MRLHGRREIMRYLGRSPQNKNGWRKIWEHYAEVIRCYSRSGHLFALSEDLDRVDRERCTTVRDVLNGRVPPPLFALLKRHAPCPRPHHGHRHHERRGGPDTRTTGLNRDLVAQAGP